MSRDWLEHREDSHRRPSTQTSLSVGFDNVKRLTNNEPNDDDASLSTCDAELQERRGRRRRRRRSSGAAAGPRHFLRAVSRGPSGQRRRRPRRGVRHLASLTEPSPQCPGLSGTGGLPRTVTHSSPRVVVCYTTRGGSRARQGPLGGSWSACPRARLDSGDTCAPAAGGGPRTAGRRAAREDGGRAYGPRAPDRNRLHLMRSPLSLTIEKAFVSFSSPPPYLVVYIL